MKKLFYTTLIFLFLLSSATAHQPRISLFLDNSAEDPIIVEEPEISKAFYGQLNGKKDYYQIENSESFLIYVNILSPLIENAKKDFQVEIFQDATLIETLVMDEDAETFYEPFAGDEYYRGPEFEREVEAGTYLIVVSNNNNQGKYSLAIGKIESFPISEILHTIWVLPSLKSDFFEKSSLTAYFNLTGVFMLVSLVILVGVVLLIVWFIRRRKKRK